MELSIGLAYTDDIETLSHRLSHASCLEILFFIINHWPGTGYRPNKVYHLLTNAVVASDPRRCMTTFAYLSVSFTSIVADLKLTYDQVRVNTVDGMSLPPPSCTRNVK